MNHVVFDAPIRAGKTRASLQMTVGLCQLYPDQKVVVVTECPYTTFMERLLAETTLDRMPGNLALKTTGKPGILNGIALDSRIAAVIVDHPMVTEEDLAKVPKSIPLIQFRQSPRVALAPTEAAPPATKYKFNEDLDL